MRCGSADSTGVVGGGRRPLRVTMDGVVTVILLGAAVYGTLYKFEHVDNYSERSGEKGKSLKFVRIIRRAHE